MATPQMGPPPDVAAAVPDVSRTMKERIIGGIGGVLSAGSGEDSSSSPLEKEMSRQHDIRLATARRHYENATTYGGILGTGEIDPQTGQPTGTDPNTGKPLTPDERKQYQAMLDGAWGDYEKAAGVSKEAKQAIQAHKGLLDLLVNKGHKALQAVMGAHQQATQAVGGAQKPGSMSPPPAADTPTSGGVNATVAPSGAASAIPPPPAYNPQSATQAPQLRQGMADNRTIAMEQRKQDILTASKIAEAQAKPPRTPFTAWIDSFKSEHGREPTTAEIDQHVIDERRKLAGDEPLGGDRVAQINRAMTDRYQVLNAGKPLPPYFTLKPDATGKDYERIDKLMEATEKAQGIRDKPPAYSATPADVQETAKAIRAGESSPVLSDYSFRDRTAIAAALHKAGFNQALAQQDYRAVQRHLTTMNGAQQTRLRQAVEFADESLPQLQAAYDRLAKLAPRSGFKVLNKGAMAAMKQMPGEAGSAAQQLDSLIADYTSELGTVYKGGNSSTDESLALAAKNISGDWNEKTFKDAIARIHQSIGLRRNSMNAVRAVGVGMDTPYERPGAETSPGGVVPPVSPPPSASPLDDLVRKYGGK